MDAGSRELTEAQLYYFGPLLTMIAEAPARMRAALIRGVPDAAIRAYLTRHYGGVDEHGTA